MQDFHPKLFGRYLLVEKLAAGGMAEVYRAKAFGLDGFEKQLAIKRILPNFSGDKQFIGMITDEAKLSVQLNHTNIVQVYDFGRISDDYFIAMEYIFGANLHDILDRLKSLHRPVPEEICVYIMSEVCRGLDYAHSKKSSYGKSLGIIHRDISPPNILVSFEGEVKVADFGIAKAAMNVGHTVAGVIKGKISYMSPEQARGENLDQRSDIFSIGMVLYEMLTGQKMFVGDTQFEVLRKIQNTRITEEHFKNAVSPELEKILTKTLAHETKDRYLTAGNMQADLTRYLNSVYPNFISQNLKTLMHELYAHEIEIGKETESKEATETFHPAKKNLDVHRSIQLKKEAISPTKVGYFSTPSKSSSSRLWILSLSAILMISFGLWIFSKTEQPSEKKESSLAGKIMVQSNPAGASILLNNQETYLLTPALLENIAVGENVNIILKKTNHEDWNKSFTLSNTSLLTINPLLKPMAKGVLVISSKPSGANIFLNDTDTGKTTPAILEDLTFPNKYRIRLQLAHYRPVEEEVLLNQKTPLKIEKDLIKLPTVSAASKKPTRAIAETHPPPITEPTTSKEKESKGAVQTMGSGFKKAGSSIKGFFTGKKKTQETTTTPPSDLPDEK